MGTFTEPEVVPSPTQDSQRLRKAFQGWGTDEKEIIRVLGHRSATQRRKIRQTYQQLFNESLIDRLHSELSGDFRKAVVLWTYDPPERDAKLANETLRRKKRGLNELQVIVEIACASSPHHLMAVRQAYCSLFHCSLEEDIISHVPIPLRELLVGLVSSYRYDREKIDLGLANSEADMLCESIEERQLDQENVTRILSTRNFFQLRATCACYKQKYGSSIYQDIMSSGYGVLESMLRVVIWCIDCPERHFAEVIRSSIAGLGTDEDSLTRIIVTRADIDMMKIKEEFFKMNKTTLDNAVIGDTSADYKDFLLTLLGASI